MSITNSLRKKSGQPRFLVFLLAVAAMVAAPFMLDLSSTTAHADGGHNLPGLTTQLTGDPIDGVTPRGFSHYFAAATGSPEPVRQLHVSVSNVNLPTDTVLSVELNSAQIGTITIRRNSPSQAAGGGSLRLSTRDGDTVPNVVAGDVLTVGAAPAAGGTTYLTGTFAAPTPFPTHTPWPTPSQTASPSPTGTPRPARNFVARLSGSNEVPPVTTDGHGRAFAGLNSTETQLRINVAFRNMSSAGTSVTINGPASTSENGPVIFTLTLPEGNGGGHHIPFIRGTFDVTAEQVAELRAGLWYIQVSSVDNPDGEIRGQLNGLTPHHGPGGGGNHGGGEGTGGGNSGGDLTSVGSDDVQLDGRSATKNDGYIPVPFDFDEDGITDIAVFRQSDGKWHVTRSSDGMTMAYRVD